MFPVFCDGLTAKPLLLLDCKLPSGGRLKCNSLCDVTSISVVTAFSLSPHHYRLIDAVSQNDIINRAQTIIEHQAKPIRQDNKKKLDCQCSFDWKITCQRTQPITRALVRLIINWYLIESRLVEVESKLLSWRGRFLEKFSLDHQTEQKIKKLSNYLPFFPPSAFIDEHLSLEHNRKWRPLLQNKCYCHVFAARVTQCAFKPFNYRWITIENNTKVVSKLHKKSFSERSLPSKVLLRFFFFLLSDAY